MSALRTSRGRAVFLTSVFPDADGAGLARRCWMWTQILAAEYDLEIVLVTAKPPLKPYAGPGVCHTVQRSGAPRSRRSLIEWINPEPSVTEALASLAGPPPERLVVFRFIMHDVASFLPRSWRAIAEMDCDDWESRTRLALARIALRRGQWWFACVRLIDALRYAWLERRVLSSYAQIYLSASDDVPALARCYGLQTVAVMPNRIAGLRRARPLQPNSRTILFVGSLDYAPNEDAILWFGSAVLPILRRLVPDVRVIAAGRGNAALSVRLDAMRIGMVHDPDDLRPLYEECALVVAPVREGGGTKLKILEALLYERPLVATQHATRGLATVSGKHLLVADRPKAFAEACAAVLTDRALAERLIDNGRNFLDEHALIIAPADRSDAV